MIQVILFIYSELYILNYSCLLRYQPAAGTRCNSLWALLFEVSGGWKPSWLNVKNRVQLRAIMKDKKFGLLHSYINHVINDVPKRNIIGESQYTIKWPDMRLNWSKAPRKITTNIDNYVIVDSIIFRHKRKKMIRGVKIYNGRRKEEWTEEDIQRREDNKCIILNNFDF